MSSADINLKHQPSLPSLCPLESAIASLSQAGGEQRGAVFTKQEVVEFILDLVGYKEELPLHRFRILEPSFGKGDFLLPIVDRLLKSWRSVSNAEKSPMQLLSNCLRGVELHKDTFLQTRVSIVERLLNERIREEDALAIADKWLVQGDFLLADFLGEFSHVVGNPPYVRQELIPDVLLAEYRSRYSTIYDRADIYIPFIERSLSLLRKGGNLGFICADRWMKNRYGGPLRKMVADNYHLKIYVNMTDTPAFHTDVMAYPAITVIARQEGMSTRVASHPKISRRELSRLAEILTANKLMEGKGAVQEVENVASGSEPWILEETDQLKLMRRLEADFPLLSATGCKVGIGVATGADKAFIGPYEELNVEADRKLRLVTTRDIVNGKIDWRGLGVINPFGNGGKLVDLKQYPLLGAYLNERKDEIAGRHVAKKTPANWYRTIDRIYPDLALKPKLLIPDIKGEASIVYENGQFYPHHNLYFITADEWHLKALQAVLLSGIAKLFVSFYSTRMRGGYMRFQAQYLRRIRLPYWSDVPDHIKAKLIAAAERGDVAECNAVVFELYGLTRDEQAAIRGLE